jgi:16S rRNA (guanine1207-N2)-methyltransferase
VSVSELHHRLVAVAVADHGELLTSAAVRGFPDAAPGLAELLGALPALEGPVADVTGSAGGGGLAAAAEDGSEVRIEVIEPSYAAVRAARARFRDEERVVVRPGLPWQLTPAAYSTVLLLPPADRGNDRVRVELLAAARALAPGGAAYAAMHKDLGAKRYEREALAWFDRVSVLSRSRGWRVVRLEGPRRAFEDPAWEDGEEPWRRGEALGAVWWSLPGVFSARGVDAGTGVLLAALADLGEAPLEGAEALDLGCGTGVLARAALGAGAVGVVALDDDLAAVLSARRNLEGTPATVLHSDLDDVLAPSVAVDAVLVNPPFHLGKQVRLPLARAFLETARRRLRAGGFALIVANRALPYERELTSWRRWESVREEAGFKVLRAWT